MGYGGQAGTTLAKFDNTEKQITNNFEQSFKAGMDKMYSRRYSRACSWRARMRSTTSRTSSSRVVLGLGTFRVERRRLADRVGSPLPFYITARILSCKSENPVEVQWCKKCVRQPSDHVLVSLQHAADTYMPSGMEAHTAAAGR